MRTVFRHLSHSILLATLGCTGVPEGLEPVQGFDAERYMGTWYEIARLDHPFERGLRNVSATYSTQSDGSIRVENRGYDPEAGEWREAIGRAYPLGDPDVGSLEVSFFGPFYGGYHVIALDEDYTSAVVAGPDRSYLWLLARDRSLDPKRQRALVSIARDGGFDVDELLWVDQTPLDAKPELGS